MDAATAPSRGKGARATRRKPVFEPLEPRVLLSGELPVVPPQPGEEPAVLSAPLEFGNQAEQLLIASLSQQFQASELPVVQRFADGWGQVDLAPAVGKALHHRQLAGLELLAQRRDQQLFGLVAELQRRRQHGWLFARLRRHDGQFTRQQDARLQRLEHRLAPRGARTLPARRCRGGIHQRLGEGVFTEALHSARPDDSRTACRPPARA